MTGEAQVVRRGLAIGIVVLGVVSGVVALVGLGSRARADRFGGLEPSPGANVLLITVDTTRADHLGAFGGDPELTPNLDRLAARGVAFLEAQSPAPITLVAHASILTGLYPYRHGIRNNGTFSLAENVPTLATALRDESYRTGAFVSAYVLARRYGLDRGFEVYDDDLSRGRQENAGEVPARRAEVTVDSAIAWLDEVAGTGEPFFCWVHLYDPHAPYDPPAGFRERFPSDPYSGEIAYMDSEIGRLLAHLETRGEADKTFVAVIGDHGEALGEHGEQTHAILLHQATTRVPWILAGPGLPEGGKVRVPVSAVDLAPTVGWLLDVELPDATNLDGVAVVNPSSERLGELVDRSLYMETMLPRYQYGWSALRGIRRGRWQVVAGARRTLFDLERDPRELVDRSASDAAALRDLEERLKAVLEIDTADAAAREVISESEREKLAALGYLGFSELERHDPPDPRDLIGAHVHMERARVLAARGLSEQALGELDAMLGEDSQNTSALGLRASVLTGMGRLDEAAATLERLIALDPDNAQSYRSLAQLELGRGRPAAALELARIGGAKRGAFGSLCAVEAAALTSLGRRDEAVSLLDERLAEDPHDPEVLASRATLHLAAGQTGPGEALLRRAVVADALHHRSRLALAALLTGSGREGEAVALLEDLLRIDPGHAEALARIGAVRAADPAAARPYLEEAVRLQPRRVEYLQQLGVCYLRLGDHRRAEATLRRGLELTPNDRDLVNNLTVVLTLEARYAEAEAALRGLLETDPAFAEARNNLALCLLYQGRAAEAEAEVRRSLAVAPELRDARLTLSEVLFTQRRYRESAGMLAELLAEAPHDHEVRARLGMALEAGGDPARALPELRAAAPVFPGHLELALALARAEERAGDPAAARELYAAVARASAPGALRDEATGALERMALAAGDR